VLIFPLVKDILGSAFIDDIKCPRAYLEVLQNDFVPFLMSYGINGNKTWSQKCGVKTLIAYILLDYFKEIFGD
jgi:hypothetical protein